MSHLVDLLAAAAWAVYKHGAPYKPEWLREIAFQAVTFRTDFRTNIGWALYEVRKGPYRGKTIMAFRGTDVNSVQQVLQDISSVYNGPMSILARRSAVVTIRKHQPDYITGHSLGGLIAEMACSYTGKPGASFAAPGPVGITENLADGGRYAGVQWRTVINTNDVVARTIGGVQGTSRSHISHSTDIQWLEFGSIGDPVDAHVMNSYIKALNSGGLE